MTQRAPFLPKPPLITHYVLGRGREKEEKEMVEREEEVLGGEEEEVGEEEGESGEEKKEVAEGEGERSRK